MRAASVPLFVMLGLAGFASGVGADLGAPVLDRSIGRLRVVAYASPVPLREGLSEWTLLVLDRETAEPVRDVDVRMRFVRHDEDPHAAHHHTSEAGSQASGFTGTRGRIEFDAAGTWRQEISISRRPAATVDSSRDEPEIRIDETVEVQRRPGFWRSHAAAVITPYAVLAAAAIHRVLRARRERDPAASG